MNDKCVYWIDSWCIMMSGAWTVFRTSTRRTAAWRVKWCLQFWTRWGSREGGWANSQPIWRERTTTISVRCSTSSSLPIKSVGTAPWISPSPGSQTPSTKTPTCSHGSDFHISYHYTKLSKTSHHYSYKTIVYYKQKQTLQTLYITYINIITFYINIISFIYFIYSE